MSDSKTDDQKSKAARLRKRIAELTKPKEEERPAEPEQPESPNDFVQRRMRELGVPDEDPD